MGYSGRFGAVHPYNAHPKSRHTAGFFTLGDETRTDFWRAVDSIVMPGDDILERFAQLYHRLRGTRDLQEQHDFSIYRVRPALVIRARKTDDVPTQRIEVLCRDR